MGRKGSQSGGMGVSMDSIAIGDETRTSGTTTCGICGWGRGPTTPTLVRRGKSQNQTQDAPPPEENIQLQRPNWRGRRRVDSLGGAASYRKGPASTQAKLRRAMGAPVSLSAITPQSGQILVGVLRTLLSNFH